MKERILYNSTAAEERPMEQADHNPKIDMAALYDGTAEKWTRDEPKLRDDLVSWPLLNLLMRSHGTGGVILDCGCGSGNICRMVSPYAKNVIGIDISKQMILEAEKLNPAVSNIVYLEGDMLLLNKYVSPSSVDLCLSVFGFCCLRSLDELRLVFQQIRQVLRIGGTAIIQIPHPLDGFLKQPSLWYNDLDMPQSYFDAGTPVRRKLRTTDGNWLLVARHHFTISHYVAAIMSAGFNISQLLEPEPPVDAIRKNPTLAREAALPSSIIFVIK